MNIVMDIDGVVADARHRLHFIKEQPKDWDAFYAAVKDDPPLPIGIALARAMRSSVIWITGRRASTMDDTKAWLIDQGLRELPLFMREDDDYRNAAVLKLGHLITIEEQLGYEVGLIIEDDPAVCEAYRMAGYNVLQANWGRDDG